MNFDHSSSSELVAKSNTDSVIPAKSPRGRCQDVPKKLTSRGKDELVLVNSGKERSSCLSKRRKTLFKKGYTLHKRTGADVLLIVENDHERRFFGTGKLKKHFMDGTLRSKGSNEVKDRSLQGTNDDENDEILPLEKTPSPEGGNTRPVESRVARNSELLKFKTIFGPSPGEL